MELTFDKGRGYVPAERNKQALIEKNDISTLPVDSIYTPVLKVNYTVESTRVGQITDYDKLTIEGLDRWHHQCAGGRELWLPAC